VNSLLVLVFISLIILVHEFGHYLAAIHAKIRVLRFQIGFGPSFFRKKLNKTIFSLNLLPLGGAVVLAGLDEGDQAKVPAEERYNTKSWGSRFLIIIAGSLMNLLLGLLIFIFTYSVLGVPQGLSKTIGNVLPETPAAKVLLAGDKILTINGQQNITAEQMVKLIHRTPAGTSLSLVIERQNKHLALKIEPNYDPKTKISTIGIVLRPEKYQRLNVFKAIYYGLLETIGFVSSFFLGLAGMLTGFDPKNIAGPIGIFDISNQAWQYGLPIFLRFFGILSLNIGLLNLLPLPALDGGRVIFLIYEKLRGRPANQNFEKYVHLLGFMILLSLIFWISYNDIHRLLK